MINRYVKLLLVKELERLLDDIKSDKLSCDNEQMERAIAMIAHRPLSAYETYTYVLHWSRSKFNDYVARGILPAGKKRSGWKELIWYEDEVRDAVKEYENKRKNK